MRGRIARWTERHPLWTPVILIVLVAGPGYWQIQDTADEAKDAATAAAVVAADLDAERVRTDFEACRSRAATITVVRQLVELSATPTRSGAFFTTVAGFDDLPADVQAYLENLDARLAAMPEDGSSFKDRALKLLVIPDCD